MSGANYECAATYQGVPVQAFSIDRKPGMSGDAGWIELALEDIGSIQVADEFRLWQSGDFREPAGPFSVEVAEKILRPTRAGGLPIGGGKKRGGALIIQTTVDGAASSRGRVIIDPLYMAPSGIEEIIEDLAEAEAHKTGRLRISVVDIRHFWRENGTPVFGRYNVVMPNGKYDALTVQKSGDPWPAAKILNMVALSLPGSPAIDRASETGGLPPPVNVLMNMEAPSLWMAKLLEAFGLELHLTLDSNILLLKRGRNHAVGRFRSFPGAAPSALTQAEPPNVQKKTVYFIDRPEAVTVVGSRRQRRFTALLIPVFIDIDGEVKRLQDIADHWDGYTLEQALEQALLRPEKQYDNIPALDARTKFERLRIAQKYFFKCFAPDFLFQKFTLPGVPQEEDIRFFPFEEAEHPLMPMLDPWWTPKEIADLSLVGPVVRIGTKDKDTSLAKTDIVVRANVIKQAYTKEIGPLKDLIGKFLQGQSELKTRLQTERTQKADEQKRLETLDKPDEFKRLGPLAGGAIFLQGRADNIVSLLGLVSQDVDRILRGQAQFRAYRDLDKERLGNEIGEIDKRLKEIEKGIVTAQVKRAGIENDVAQFGFARLWVNAPWGPVETADFTVQADTGLVFFNDVVGVMDFPAVYDKETAVLVSPGNAEISFMTEAKLGSPTEFSCWTFMQDPAKGGAKPRLVRISEPSNLKPTIVHDPDLVLFENEFAEAMNADPATEKAARHASAFLEGPRQQAGYQYRYPGCWKVITDDSVNEVSWKFDGDSSHTDIVANNPDQDIGFASLTRKRHEEELIYGRRR